MVDGRYLGRGDKTKRYLTDPEVERLHAARAAAHGLIETMVDREIDRDPVPEESREQAHLFLIAEPNPGRPRMLAPLVDAPDWQSRLTALRARALGVPLPSSASDLTRFEPTLSSFASFDLRANGLAATTHNLAEGRVFRGEGYHPESVGELEVSEDGGLRLFLGRLSDNVRADSGLDAEQLIFDSAAVLYVRHLIGLMIAIAEHAGYFGNWDLAVAATGLRGMPAYRMVQSAWSPPRFTDDSYRRTTTATYAELASRPGAVTDRLVGSFLRALGTRTAFGEALTDATRISDEG